MTHRYLSRHSDHEILTEDVTSAHGRSAVPLHHEWHHPEEVAG